MKKKNNHGGQKSISKRTTCQTLRWMIYNGRRSHQGSTHQPGTGLWAYSGYRLTKKRFERNQEMFRNRHKMCERAGVPAFTLQKEVSVWKPIVLNKLAAFWSKTRFSLYLIRVWNWFSKTKHLAWTEPCGETLFISYLFSGSSSSSTIREGSSFSWASSPEQDIISIRKHGTF